MKLITKLRHGLPLVPAILAKLDEIVDYLLATRLVQGPGVQLSEDANGVVISVTGISRSRKDDDYAFVTVGPGICISGTSETPAVSGSTNSTVPIDGSTISLLLEAGTSNVSITDGQNGSKVISVTGSTAGDFDVPPYSQLYVSGGLSASQHGRAMTFIVPVKAGTIGFWDEGGGAVGVYTNKAGTTRYALTNQQGYEAQADGWMRISVYDDGSTPGECLSFFSPTGGVPLYKYGSSSTGGIGYPDYVALAGGTASNSLGTITDEEYDGTTPSAASMPQNPKLGITHIIPVPANAPIKYYSSFSCLVRFAPEAGGSGHFYYDLSNELEWTPNCKGWLRISILDDGTHESDCIRLYVGGENWSDAVAMHKCGSFGNNGATGIASSISGGTVTISLSGGAGSVKLKPGNNISIDGSNGLYTISVTGITSSGGGDSSLNFVTSVGVIVLTGSSKQLVYCPQATDSGGYKYNQYDFSAPGTATINALNAATGKSLVNTGQFDDEGNIIFVLPENPTALTSVDIRLTSGSTDTIVCTVDGKKIVDTSGGQQGVSNGVCDDGMGGGDHYMYVYITSISGFPEYYDAYGNETYIAQHIESDGGCWVRLDIDN